jgi:ubiquinone/menaquinone biosynthesis C-methylase UbiE
MREFYEHFYAATEQSHAHACFCEHAFGRNLCQHGFADMIQLDALIAAIDPKPGDRWLDLGCGNGMIAEYISDTTGAHVTGLDYIETAIAQAQARTTAKADRLAFAVGDINALALPPATFDAIIAIDTIYFSNDYPATIRSLLRGLRSGGHLAFLYGHGILPGDMVTDFPLEKLEPTQTPLALALKANGVAFTVQEFTEEEYRLAQRRIQVLTALATDFQAEGIMFIY